MKIRPVGAEWFHTNGQTGGKTDRQTDRQTERDRKQTDRHDEANSWISQFCEHAWKFCVLPTERIYVLLWFAEQTAFIFLHSI
jgi:hypothetical protein